MHANHPVIASGLAARSRPASPPTSWGTQSGPILRFAGVAERRKATLLWPNWPSDTVKPGVKGAMERKLHCNLNGKGTLYFTTTHLSEK